MNKLLNERRERARFIEENLKNLITNPKTELNYEDEFQLLIAVILSAQCTDKRVNVITKELFKNYGNCYKLGYANIEDIEKIIKSCGFYKNKAKNIINCSKKICEEFGGKVPDNFEDLQKLDGVGRKTASVMMAVAFNKPAMPVDTHLFRVARRLGLSEGEDVLEVEQDLKDAIDESEWIDMHHYLLLFGRYYCKAINPECRGCKFIDICVKIKNDKK